MKASFGVVIPAAGSGSRFRREGEAGSRKQFLELAGRPLLHFSLATFSDLDDVERITVVAPPEHIERVEALIEVFSSTRARSSLPAIGVTAGGARRQDSVENGLRTFWDDLEFALVHDAARPLLRPQDAGAVLHAVREHGAAALGYPATDSLRSARGGFVETSLDRGRIWQVQTPQGASCEGFRRAYAAAGDEEGTDEVALLTRVGVEVALVEGARDNIKVTHPGDEVLAEFWLARRKG